MIVENTNVSDFGYMIMDKYFDSRNKSEADFIITNDQSIAYQWDVPVVVSGDMSNLAMNVWMFT